jgi:hypothetical protein
VNAMTRNLILHRGLEQRSVLQIRLQAMTDLAAEGDPIHYLFVHKLNRC